MLYNMLFNGMVYAQLANIQHKTVAGFPTVINDCFGVVPRCGASGFRSLTAFAQPESVAASAMCAVAKLWKTDAPR